MTLGLLFNCKLLQKSCGIQFDYSIYILNVCVGSSGDPAVLFGLAAARQFPHRPPHVGLELKKEGRKEGRRGCNHPKKLGRPLR
jgi:hypothetical protein